jgi:hypothetical protein
LKDTHKLSKLKWFPDEMINSKPGESGCDNFLGVSTGENDLQVRSNVLRFFKDLSAWHPW